MSTMAMRHPKIRVPSLVASAFLLPAVLFFILFRYYPLAQGLLMSFFNWDYFNPPGNFVGLQNFVYTVQSPIFWLEIKNTLILFVFGIIFGFWVPIVQALLLSQIRFAHGLLRYLYVLPMAIPAMSGVIILRYIYNSDYGAANGLMQLLGLSKQNWISDPSLVKFSLRVLGLLGGGMGILIYLAAILNISPETLESAMIDGANAWQRIWRIILPGIWPIISIQFVLGITGSLLAFDFEYAMTRGGPGYSSTTLVMGIYNKAFVEIRPGEAAAWAVVAMLITMVFTAIQLKSMREETN